MEANRPHKQSWECSNCCSDIEYIQPHGDLVHTLECIDKNSPPLPKRSPLRYNTYLLGNYKPRRWRKAHSLNMVCLQKEQYMCMSYPDLILPDMVHRHCFACSK